MSDRETRLSQTSDLPEVLETLRNAMRTDPADRFWEGWDAALVAVWVALVPDIRRKPRAASQPSEDPA